jgi:hypothetical protein
MRDSRMSDTITVILETCSRMNISYDDWVAHHESQGAEPDAFWCAWVDEWHNVRQQLEAAE